MMSHYDIVFLFTMTSCYCTTNVATVGRQFSASQDRASTEPSIQLAHVGTNLDSIKPVFIYVLLILSFSEESSCEFVPMLKFVVTHGNCTTYQWRTGEKPEKVIEPKTFIDTTDEQDASESQDVSYQGSPQLYEGE